MENGVLYQDGLEGIIDGSRFVFQMFSIYSLFMLATIPLPHQTSFWIMEQIVCVM